jgi:oxygen-dependent protoporphyrinogen oxidase
MGTNSPTRVAVIGGGISGLAAAYRCVELADESQQPLQMTMFEAGDRVGGVFGTSHIDDYLVERGADMFITNKPWALDLCRRLGVDDQLIPTDETFRRSLVLRNGRPVPVPEGFMLLSPAKVWPILSSSLFSPWGKLRMGLEYIIPRRADNGDESLASFVRRRFGREALDRLVQPLVGGIYTSDPEKLSLRATMPRFLEMEKTHRSLIRASKRQASKQAAAEQQGSGARYGLFVAPKGGMTVILDELERRVKERAEIRLDTNIRRIDPVETGGWSLTLDDGSNEQFDRVVIAIRSHQVAELIGGFDNQLAECLRKIPYASSAIVVSGHRLADISNPLDAFGLVIPHAEKRKILAVSYASRKLAGRAPDGHVLLRTFVGGAMQPELLEQSDEEILRMVRDELNDILGVGGDPDFSVVVRYQNAMPQYHVGHLELVEQIESRTETHLGLALAGNAYRGVGIPDCIHSGEQAAERVWAADFEATHQK